MSHTNKQSDFSHRSQEPRLARVPPIPTRRLFSIPDSSPENSNRWVLCTLCFQSPSVRNLSELLQMCSRLCLSVCPSTCLSVRPPVPLSWLSRSSSYTRRLHSQPGNEFTSSTPSLLHRSVVQLATPHLFVLFLMIGCEQVTCDCTSPHHC